MKAHEVFPSRWLKADALDRPVVVTISSITSCSFHDGRTTRYLSFDEIDEDIRLSRTNWEGVAAVLGIEDDELWIGGQIELYATSALFEGREVPVIRVRPPRGWSDASG